MIDRLLSGSWSVEDFRRAYYFFWLEQVPADVLSDEAEQFFWAIQEKLDWTTREPTSEERQYGWLTEDEYVDWVKLHRMRSEFE